MNMTTVAIKIQTEDKSDIRRVKVSPEIHFPQLVDLLKSMFRYPDSDWECLRLKYEDNESDICTITSEMELREAFDAKKEKVLRLVLSFDRKENIAPKNIEHKQQKCKNWGERRAEVHGLHEQGIALMEEKKYEEAVIIFSKQADMLPPWRRAVPYYNIACCEALLGNVDSSLGLLSRAIEFGFRDVAHIENDEDLASLRGLEAYETILSELRATKREKCGKWRRHCGGGAGGRGDWRRQCGAFAEAFAKACETKNEQETEQKNPVEEKQEQPQVGNIPISVGNIPISINVPAIIEAIQPLLGSPIIGTIVDAAINNPEIITNCFVHNNVNNNNNNNNTVNNVNDNVDNTNVNDNATDNVVNIVVNDDCATAHVNDNNNVNNDDNIKDNSSVSPQPHQYAAELAALEQMGFTNVFRNLKALMKARGNLSEAVGLLLR